MTRRCGMALALTLAACHDTTGGALIAIPFQVGGIERDPTAPFTFTTDSGWTVNLDQALAVLGPFYFNIQPPDPDFFRSGVVIMQATEQVVIDALNPSLQVAPGGADGETGHAVAVEIDFFTITYQYNQVAVLTPPLLGKDPDGTLQYGTAFVAGQAVKGGVTVPFAGHIVVDENAITPSIPIEAAACAQGAVCDLNFTARTKALTLRVDPSSWFDAQPNFCDLVPGSEGPTCQPVSGQVYGWTSNVSRPTSGSTSAFNAALLKGMHSATGAYSFAITDN